MYIDQKDRYRPQCEAVPDTVRREPMPWGLALALSFGLMAFATIILTAGALLYLENGVKALFVAAAVVAVWIVGAAAIRSITR